MVKKLLSLLVILGLAVSPVFASKGEGDKGKDKPKAEAKKDNKTDNKTDKKDKK
ncbi:MAG: hypothetical protein RMI63_08015 [Caldimicrobium sp.]|nr:hypothetical protein [Caldimicrobium sp.]MCX7613539.1 hypothetical protein [Caldimicrobium sp.]MDW8094946.1 hypothetical protein [Caldimicrobium sp.]